MIRPVPLRGDSSISNDRVVINKNFEYLFECLSNLIASSNLENTSNVPGDTVPDALNNLLQEINNLNNSTSNLFVSDIDVILSPGKSLGRFLNGETIPSAGRTPEEVVDLLAKDFLQPAFTSFAISGLSTILEVGTNLTTSYDFVWNTSNNANIVVDTININDITNSIPLATNISNDMIENISLSINVNSETTNTWQISATDTNNGTFTRNFSISWRYRNFYGPVATTPNTSSGVRSLAANSFSNVNGFTLNTGSTQTKFVIALAPGNNLVQVIDLDALNANLTLSYINVGTVNVEDANGDLVSYTLYELNLATPYSSNHRHQITTT